jgi:hypothetical protein
LSFFLSVSVSFAVGVVGTGGKLPPTTPQSVQIFGKMWPLGVSDTDSKFTVGVIYIYTGKIFDGVVDTNVDWRQICCLYRNCRWFIAVGVIDTGGVSWVANISANFGKKLKRALRDYQRPGVKWFIKK